MIDMQEKLEALHTATCNGNLKQVQALAKKKLVAAKVKLNIIFIS
jgi:hypothetical protein